MKPALRSLIWLAGMLLPVLAHAHPGYPGHDHGPTTGFVSGLLIAAVVTAGRLALRLARTTARRRR